MKLFDGNNIGVIAEDAKSAVSYSGSGITNHSKTDSSKSSKTSKTSSKSSQKSNSTVGHNVNKGKATNKSNSKSSKSSSQGSTSQGSNPSNDSISSRKNDRSNDTSISSSSNMQKKYNALIPGFNLSSFHSSNAIMKANDESRRMHHQQMESYPSDEQVDMYSDAIFEDASMMRNNSIGTIESNTSTDLKDDMIYNAFVDIIFDEDMMPYNIN